MSIVRSVLLMLGYVTIGVVSNDNIYKFNKILEHSLISEYGQNGILSRAGFNSFAARVLGNVSTQRHTTTNSVTYSAASADSNVLETCMKNLTREECGSIVETQCHDSNTLFDLFSMDSALNVSSISLTFPALIHNLAANICFVEDKGRLLKAKVKQKPTSAQSWGYGVGFVAIVCAVSNIGGVMTPCMKSKFFQHILMFFVALAASALGATGALVLIPESLQLDAILVPNYAWKMAAVLGGVYFFYMFERILKISLQIKKQKREAKGKEIVVSPTEITEHHNHSHLPSEEDVLVQTDTNIATESDATESEAAEPVKRKRQVAPVAWLMLIGDALHNFVDGIAIGAAFTESVILGINVSVAVICEELPHEFGDIAILLHAGMSMKRALFFNFLAALTIVIGLVVGIIVGESTNANTWVFGAAGGMFLYIAMVDMIPEMGEQASLASKTGGNPLSILFIQNLGLLSGFAIICVLVNVGSH